MNRLIGFLLIIGILSVGIIDLLQIQTQTTQTISELKNIDNILTQSSSFSSNKIRNLSIESESNETLENDIQNSKNNNKLQDNKQNEISKFWEYILIIRQYILTLLLWIIIKFFDNSLIKKEEYIMFVEGIAFGFFCCFGIFSIIGFILSLILNYNLQESVEFAHHLNSFTTTAIIWISSFLLIAFFSLTQQKQRGFKEKFILTIAIIPSVFLAFVLPAQGIIILMA